MYHMTIHTICKKLINELKIYFIQHITYYNMLQQIIRGGVRNMHTPAMPMISPALTVPIFESLYEMSKSGHSVNIPRIVVIGNQSSGKTSLLEAMCSINNLFEKKAGLATKRPMYIYLNKIQEGEADYVKIGTMGEKISSMDKARRRISEENNIEGISSEPLDVAIYSPNISHSCNLVDLPGFISTVRQGQNEDMPAKIKSINEKYILDDSNLKLIVMSATEDIALSLGLMEIKKARQLHNSLGVFTKIDLIVNDRVGTTQLTDLLLDRSYTSFNCVGVKLRSTADVTAGITIPEMLQNEETFIKKYYGDDISKQGLKLGMQVLMKDISDEQIRRISHELPSIKRQLENMIESKKHGSTILQRLAQSNDMSEISKELDRIITEIHPESDLRIDLERKIDNKIRSYVSEFITKNSTNPLGKSPIRFRKNEHDPIFLNFARSLLNETTSTTHDPELFSRNLMYGLCKADVQNNELERLRLDNLHRSLLSPFIKFEKVSTHNKSAFIRNVQKIVNTMIASNFGDAIVTIVLNEIKEHILQGSTDAADDIGRVFFIHIFEKICERANQDELKRAITRMIIREKRLNVDYLKLTEKIHSRIANRVSDFNTKPSLFESDKYPVSVELYGSHMFDAYIDCLIDELSKDCYRITSENLLDPIITNAIRYSLDTVSKRDFTIEQQAIKTQIDKLVKQLETLTSVIDNDNKQNTITVHQA